MRPRKTDRHLPPCVYFKHGQFWHVKAGKWHALGPELSEALAAYARRVDVVRGSMPEVIDRALRAHFAAKPRLAENTKAQYLLCAVELKKALQEFSPSQVKGTHVAKIKAAGAKTPNMTNRRLSVLRIVFNYAVEWGEAESNPCVGVKRHEEGKRDRYITDDEFWAIYSHAGDRLKVIMDLQYLTGQRINDVLTMRRSDITEEGLLLKPEKTKNSSGTKMLLRWTPELRQAVARAKAISGDVPAITLLRGRGGKAPNYRTVADQFNKAAAAAGVADAKLNDQRAKAATDAKRQGVDPQALLGHASPAMTGRYLRSRETQVIDGPSFRLSKRQQKKSP